MYCGADQLRLLKAHNEILKYILKEARMCKGKCAHVYGFWLKDELQHFRCFVKNTNVSHCSFNMWLQGPRSKRRAAHTLLSLNAITSILLSLKFKTFACFDIFQTVVFKGADVTNKAKNKKM